VAHPFGGPFATREVHDLARPHQLGWLSFSQYNMNRQMQLKRLPQEAPPKGRLRRGRAAQRR
jgi:hypothetical protein